MKLIAAGFLFISISVAGGTAHAQWRAQSSGTSADFRGLSAVSDAVAWASGTGGTFARTTDGGATWHAGTVPGAESLDFRDVDAFDANTAYLLSIGKGDSSRVYKTTDGGKLWRLQFTNSNPDAFFDAMAFWDRDHGIAFSDPVGGRFLVITTDDGGATWNQVPAENTPAAITGESAFAASGSCITVQGKNNVWFATGGAAARVFRSTDRGRTWAVARTQIISGVESAGIFSIAFKGAANGVVVGGDYKKPNEAKGGVAATTDGGRTWKLVALSNPAGYRSSVAYVPGGVGSTLVAVGTSGSDISVDGGVNWTSLDKENYNSVSFAGSVWAAGPAGRIAKLAVTLPGAQNRARRF
ncbi:MAG TPA: glycosyl hydrolase [Blastocatellia bacterium]|nr:glycosyl hydrolase [Blastocatellia bacterium]